MSEPTNLVPNLNEIMEEYVERENETVQATKATQVVTEQDEEMDKVNRMFESIKEESRKWKRRTEETQIE